MKPKLLTLALCSACLVVALQFAFSLRGYSAGELEPPGAPAPTMVSLAELSQQVETIQGRIDSQLPGGKVLVLTEGNTAVSVWNDLSSSWSRQATAGTFSPPRISNENVLVIASNGVVSVWSNATRSWNSTSLSGTVVESIGSNGYFFLRTDTNAVLAWNKQTAQFTGTNVGAPIVGRAGSEGRVVFVTSTRRAAIWTPELGNWQLNSFSGDLTPFGTDDF